MFEDVINLLLEKKANINADKEAELNAFIEELDAKYSEREEKINELLKGAGYVEPVEEEVEEEVNNEEVVEEVQENTTEEEDWR